MDWKNIIKSALPNDVELDDTALETLANSVQSKAEEETKGLRDNRDTIRDDLEKRKTEIDRLEGENKKFANIDINAYNKFTESLSKANLSDSDITPDRYVALKVDRDKLTAQVEELNGQLQSTQTQYTNLHGKFVDGEIQRDIKSQFQKIGIKPEFVDTLYQAKKGMAETINENGSVKVVYNLDGAKYSAEDWAKKWSETDEAKTFIGAPLNGGGNANGDGGAGASNPDAGDVFSNDQFAFTD